MTERDWNDGLTVGSDRYADAAERGAAKAEIRPGDQARPVTADTTAPGAHDELAAMLRERRAYGLARYGTTLQPHTGRNTGRDLVDELVDAAVYAITLRHELADLEEALRRLLVDYGPCESGCACSAAHAARLLTRRGVTL